MTTEKTETVVANLTTAQKPEFPRPPEHTPEFNAGNVVGMPDVILRAEADVSKLRAYVYASFVADTGETFRYVFSVAPNGRSVSARARVLRTRTFAEDVSSWSVGAEVEHYRFPTKWEVAEGLAKPDVATWKSQSRVGLTGHGGRWQKRYASARRQATRMGMDALIAAFDKATPGDIIQQRHSDAVERAKEIATMLRDDLTTALADDHEFRHESLTADWLREHFDKLHAAKLEIATIESLMERLGIEKLSDDNT